MRMGKGNDLVVSAVNLLTISGQTFTQSPIIAASLDHYIVCLSAPFSLVRAAHT